MDRAGLEAWMEAYRRAWVSNDPAEVGALFTEDAVYSQDVEMTSEVWAVEGDVALVHWDVVTRNHGDPVRVQYDGVLVLRFDGGRCREHREFFFRRELH